MRELTIAANMIALARNRKGDGKRSAMLRMIMPFLSRDTGDKLADAIARKDSKHFATEWDKVKKEITARLAIHHKKKQAHTQHAKHTKHGHHATAADVSTFVRDDGTSVCVRTYGAPEKIRININGNDVFEGAAPAETATPLEQPVDAVVVPKEEACTNPIPAPTANINIDSGQTGCNYSITDPQIVEMIKLVCERLLMDADPCPIPANRCDKHQWVDCRECIKNVPKPFDPNADILELFDKLVTCRSF